MRVVRETLPAGIAVQLRRQIETGALPPGERLPGHRGLATQFDVSLSTIREAISMLVSDGLITTRAGKGTFVAVDQPVPLRVGRPLQRTEVEELVEARISRGSRPSGQRASRSPHCEMRSKGCGGHPRVPRSIRMPTSISTSRSRPPRTTGICTRR